MTGAIAAAYAPDLFPATSNWANISGGTGALSNADVEIAGIDVAITLRATISSYAAVNGGGTFRAVINSVAQTPVAIADAASVDLSVSAGDDVHFTSDISGGPTGSVSYTVTVTNQATGGTQIDTFTASHSW